MRREELTAEYVRSILLGRFNNIDEAVSAYAKAAREIHGEFARVA
jgi:hypothetical protein